MMARSHASRITSKKLLAAAAATLLVLALLPTPASRWVRELRGPVEVIVGPIQSPIASLIRAVRPRPNADPLETATVEQLARERDEFQYRYHRAQAEIEQLKQLIADLSRGLSLNPELPVRQVSAAVIGGGSDPASTLLKVKAGRNAGVEIQSVAVVAGVHLVGRVTAVHPVHCDVRPITDRAMGQIQGVIYLDDLTRGPMCALRPNPAERGTLSGDVEAMPETGVGPAPPEIRPGMVVRVMDGAWPEHAQGLIIGEVERVERKANQRLTVTVRPVHRVDRVSQVILRVLGAPPSSPTAAAAASDGGEGRR